MGHWMHTHLWFLAILATQCSVCGSKAGTIEGRVLDIPLPYPATLAGGDISTPLQKGVLVDRVLQPAQAK